MSADSPRRSNIRGVPAIIPPEVVSDRSIIDSVAGFINDVTLANQPTTDPKDTINWARFESAADISDPCYGDDWELEGNVAPPLLLILGYGMGVQIWAIPANGEAVEVLTWRHGIVSALRMLPKPLSGDVTRADEPIDLYSDRRPLLAICEGGNTSSGGVNPQFCSVNFLSLRTGTQVKIIKFKNPVLDILANRTSVVVTFHERIAIFDARTLEDRLTVTTCFPSPGVNPNPVALGSRWLAYSENKLLASKRSGGGCDGDGVSSYTATVLNAAKSLGKGLRELGEQVAAGLTGTAGNSAVKAGSFDSGSGDVRQAGVVTVLDIKYAIKDMSPTSGTPVSVNGTDPIVAHFIAHNEALVAMEFDNSGMILVTADKRGHNFHVFRIQPHPVGSTLAAVHHLYVLHRGDTTAKVQNISFSLDTRWVAVSTLRGTTHVFPITPYGGVPTARTHSNLHVVNKLSSFHQSAGLTADGRSSSPLSHLDIPNFSQQLLPYCNQTMPPFPRPNVVTPLAQLRQPFALGTAPTTSVAPTKVEKSNRQRLSSLSDDNGKPLSVCAIFAKSRSWLLDPPNLARDGPAHKLQRKAVDSLFVMAGHGALIQYDLDVSYVAKDKKCDDKSIDLDVEAKAQWNLGRRDPNTEIMPPLPSDNWLVKDRLSCALVDSSLSTEKEDRSDSWLAQVEIITHAGPSRRLWMGPQFVFKTYNTPSGSSLSHIDSEAVEIGMNSNSKGKSERSAPVNMPISGGSHSSVPVLIESGSYSSIEQSPKLMDRFRHDYMDSDYSLAHGESRLKEDLADAMRESPSVTHKDTTGVTPNRSTPTASTTRTLSLESSQSKSLQHHQPFENVVNPLGTVTTVNLLADKEDPLLDNPYVKFSPEDYVIHENCDESLFRPVVVFCDDGKDVDRNKKNDEYTKPPAAIENKLIVPVIEKALHIELTKKAAIKKSEGKFEDSSLLNKTQNLQRESFEEKEKVEEKAPLPSAVTNATTTTATAKSKKNKYKKAACESELPKAQETKKPLEPKVEDTPSGIKPRDEPVFTEEKFKDELQEEISKSKVLEQKLKPEVISETKSEKLSEVETPIVATAPEKVLEVTKKKSKKMSRDSSPVKAEEKPKITAAGKRSKENSPKPEDKVVVVKCKESSPAPEVGKSKKGKKALKPTPAAETVDIELSDKSSSVTRKSVQEESSSNAVSRKSSWEEAGNTMKSSVDTNKAKKLEKLDTYIPAKCDPEKPSDNKKPSIKDGNCPKILTELTKAPKTTKSSKVVVVSSTESLIEATSQATVNLESKRGGTPKENQEEPKAFGVEPEKSEVFDVKSKKSNKKTKLSRESSLKDDDPEEVSEKQDDTIEHFKKVVESSAQPVKPDDKLKSACEKEPVITSKNPNNKSKASRECSPEKSSAIEDIKKPDDDKAYTGFLSDKDTKETAISSKKSKASREVSPEIFKSSVTEDATMADDKLKSEEASTQSCSSDNEGTKTAMSNTKSKASIESSPEITKSSAIEDIKKPDDKIKAVEVSNSDNEGTKNAMSDKKLNKKSKASKESSPEISQSTVTEDIKKQDDKLKCAEAPRSSFSDSETTKMAMSNKKLNIKSGESSLEIPKSSVTEDIKKQNDKEVSNSDNEVTKAAMSNKKFTKKSKASRESSPEISVTEYIKKQDDKLKSAEGPTSCFSDNETTTIAMSNKKLNKKLKASCESLPEISKSSVTEDIKKPGDKLISEEPSNSDNDVTKASMCNKKLSKKSKASRESSPEISVTEDIKKQDDKLKSAEAPKSCFVDNETTTISMSNKKLNKKLKASRESSPEILKSTVAEDIKNQDKIKSEEASRDCSSDNEATKTAIANKKPNKKSKASRESSPEVSKFSAAKDVKKPDVKLESDKASEMCFSDNETTIIAMTNKKINKKSKASRESSPEIFKSSITEDIKKEDDKLKSAETPKSCSFDNEEAKTAISNKRLSKKCKASREPSPETLADKKREQLSSGAEASPELLKDKQAFEKETLSQKLLKNDSFQENIQKRESTPESSKKEVTAPKSNKKSKVSRESSPVKEPIASTEQYKVIVKEEDPTKKAEPKITDFLKFAANFEIKTPTENPLYKITVKDISAGDDQDFPSLNFSSKKSKKTKKCVEQTTESVILTLPLDKQIENATPTHTDTLSPFQPFDQVTPAEEGATLINFESPDEKLDLVNFERPKGFPQDIIFAICGQLTCPSDQSESELPSSSSSTASASEETTDEMLSPSTGKKKKTKKPMVQCNINDDEELRPLICTTAADHIDIEPSIDTTTMTENNAITDMKSSDSSSDTGGSVVVTTTTAESNTTIQQQQQAQYQQLQSSKKKTKRRKR